MSVLLSVLSTVSAAALIGFGALLLRAWPRVRDFLEDWAGEAPRPGVPARPGVMVRLQRIETELHPNGGRSLSDAINRTDTAVAGITGRLDDLAARVDQLATTTATAAAAAAAPTTHVTVHTGPSVPDPAEGPR